MYLTANPFAAVVTTMLVMSSHWLAAWQEAVRRADQDQRRAAGTAPR